MANRRSASGMMIIIMTVIFSILLMLVPLPDSLRLMRPEWVAMTLIYWSMALPNRVGIGISWLVGLMMDVTMGTPLGVFALAYATVVYIVLRTHLQLRLYPLRQQASLIMTLVLIVNIILALLTARSFNWQLILPAVSSTLLWPIVYFLLRAVRRHFNVR